MKKGTLFISLLMTTCLVAGCGAQNMESTDNSTVATVETTSEITSAGSVGTSGDNTETAGQEDATPTEASISLTIDQNVLNDATLEALNKFKEAHPEYQINIVEEYDLYAKDRPTVIVVGINDALTLGRAGVLADMNQLPDQQKVIRNLSQNIETMIKDENGSVYAIPFSAYAYGLMCNAALFKEAGLTDENGVPLLPTTWTELADTAAKIKKATGKAGFCFPAQDYAGAELFECIMWNYGLSNVCTQNQDGSYTSNLDSEEAIRALEFMKDLKWKYDALTDAPQDENLSTQYEQLSKDAAAMCLGANDSLKLPISYGMDSNALALGGMPTALESDEAYTIFDGLAYGFSADASVEELEAACVLMEELGLNENCANLFKASLNQQIPNAVPAMFQAYYDKVQTPGYLREIETKRIAPLYEALNQALVGAMTDPNADVTELMQAAHEHYQEALDRQD